MKFLTLPLNIRRRLIEHEVDILTPKQIARTEKYAQPCPRCGGALHQHLSDQPFNNISPLPRTTARCVDCGHEIDTQSGMIVKLGNVGKIEDPFPTIKPRTDDED